MCFRGQEAVTWIEEPPLIDEMEKRSWTKQKWAKKSWGERYGGY